MGQREKVEISWGISRCLYPSNFDAQLVNNWVKRLSLLLSKKKLVYILECRPVGSSENVSTLSVTWLASTARFAKAFGILATILFNWNSKMTQLIGSNSN